MITSQDRSLTEPRRQSLWAVVLLAVRTLRQIGIVQLLLVVGAIFSRVPSLLAFAALAVVLALVLFALAALQWWRYTFHVSDGELIVHRGVLQRQTLSVPLERVQSVSLEQKLLHRIVSLVQVSLDTAGTDDAEFVIDAVDQPVAAALQQVVANYRLASTAEVVSGETPPPPESEVLRHDPSRVLKVALSQSPFTGLVLLAPLLAVGGDVVDYLPFDLPTIEEPTVGWWLVWFVPALLVAGLLFSLILNVIRVFLTDWNLTLRSSSAGFRRDAGLLSTTSVAAPVPRVQLFDVRQGPVERRFGIHSVVLETVGSSNLDLPGCDLDQLNRIRSLALASSPGVRTLEERVSSAEVFLRTRNMAVLAALVCAGLWSPFGGWAALSLVSVPVVWAITRREVRLRRWGLAEEAIADRTQLVGWRRKEMLLRKLNVVTVRQSLFERKRGLATVTISSAAGVIRIGMIPVERARQVRDWALYVAETDRRVWM